MRVLLVSALEPEVSDIDAVERALVGAGSEVRALRGGASGATREAALAARIAKEALLFRPKVALVEVSSHLSATTLALEAGRIPYLLWASGTADLEPAEGPRELLDGALRTAAHRAAAVIVGTDEAAEALARRAQIEEMELLEAGLDLEGLPLGDRAEARAALQLPANVQVLGLVGRLDDATELPMLSLAHRQLAGVTLLVAGDGPQESTLFAMSGATRPSSPVIHIGPLTPATRVITACAADVGLALDREQLSPESWALAALGRRQVTFDVPGTDAVAAAYPDHRTVFAAPPHPDAFREVLGAALAEEREAGPLPPEAIRAARERLDAGTRWVRLAERVIQCA